ncbi:Regulator of G-protein signaling 4 [Hondaea fermentalgiana]|uniref:Regulator of G-protein signaling 4 n=1 Tax=Hondaea fermentalgiana TaxID=2315210 RepID=A0A2R5G210_9STRA|nr:Regulator of G-protein signaling 4 [Hondaea fermentalgiana]|eukprot:GBG25057.1 Regulator of G-protein signaling 4 [Hondaea fermentalgiana]
MGACLSKGKASSAGNKILPTGVNGSLELTQTDKDFRTMVYRKRRLSDTTLTKIVDDPIVSHTFRQFLAGELGEQKLEFFLATEKYRMLPSETSLSSLQAEAETMVNNFVGEDGNLRTELGIDTVTCDQLLQDLQARQVATTSHSSSFAAKDGKRLRYEVTCTNPDVLRRAFLLAAMKTFQQLKFEYLPAFMTSKAFSDLRGEEGFFADEQDAIEKAGKLLEDMDITYMISNPIGHHYLCQYAEKVSAFDGLGLEVLDLYEQLTTYSHLYDVNARAKRLFRLIRRHADLASKFPAMQRLLDDRDENPQKYDKPSAAVLKELEDEVLMLLRTIEADFRASEVFKSMTKQIATSSLADIDKINTLNVRRSTRKTIADLENFAEQRNLKAIEEANVTLETVLMNSQGLVFFRKFAIQNFMEDSILFWIAVERYKDALTEMGSARNFEFMQSAGNGLARDFLQDDSPMQINVSAELRENTLGAFRNEATCSLAVFDKAQEEVFKLLHHNLWRKFRETPRFKYLIKRFKEREFIRETQGHVGQAALDQRRSSLRLPIFNDDDVQTVDQNKA